MAMIAFVIGSTGAFSFFLLYRVQITTVINVVESLMMLYTLLFAMATNHLILLSICFMYWNLAPNRSEALMMNLSRGLSCNVM